MRRSYIIAGIVLVGAAALAAGLSAPATAQSQERGEAKTPSSWSWEMRGGRRVPRGNRVENADGSWREEVRDGDCVTIRTKSAAGEYREVRRCD